MSKQYRYLRPKQIYFLLFFFVYTNIECSFVALELWQFLIHSPTLYYILYTRLTPILNLRYTVSEAWLTQTIYFVWKIILTRSFIFTKYIR